MPYSTSIKFPYASGITPQPSQRYSITVSRNVSRLIMTLTPKGGSHAEVISQAIAVMWIVFNHPEYFVGLIKEPGSLDVQVNNVLPGVPYQEKSALRKMMISFRSFFRRKYSFVLQGDAVDIVDKMTPVGGSYVDVLSHGFAILKLAHEYRKMHFGMSSDPSIFDIELLGLLPGMTGPTVLAKKT